jgi:hypothetical protein
MKAVISIALITGVISASLLREFFGVGLSVIGGLAMVGAFLVANIWLRRLERNEGPLPTPPASLNRQVRKR